MRPIEDGNFAGWLRVTLFFVGAGMVFGGLAFGALPRWMRAITFLFGFAVMAVGGISSRAHLLKIKPFDNSYKKARDSYKAKDNETDKSK
jgi:hypothetical protein